MSKRNHTPKQSHRTPDQQRMYRNRRIRAGAAGVVALLGAYEGGTLAYQGGSAVVRYVGELNTPPKFNDTVRYTVKHGDTEWSVATGEGPGVANSGQAMFNAMNDIDRQLPKDQQATHTLVPGEVIMLPKGSQNNGTTS